MNELKIAVYFKKKFENVVKIFRQLTKRNFVQAFVVMGNSFTSAPVMTGNICLMLPPSTSSVPFLTEVHFDKI